MFALIFGCAENEEPQEMPLSDPIETMNDNLILPAGSFQALESDFSVDETIEIVDNPNGPSISTVMPITPGQQMDGSVSFTAGNANVVAAGMRFGTSGPINFVNVPSANGQSQGTMNVPFQVSANTCANLSQVCHDIKCYEFALTSEGKISRSNIRDVALMCGGCDEPSCRSLIQPPCDGGGQDGNPRFNLQWDQEWDIDLYVQDPTGEIIYYANAFSASGGELDLDCICDCTRIENVFWGNGGPSGTYTYWVENAGSCDANASSTNFTLRVYNNGVIVATNTGLINDNIDESTRWTYNQP